MERSALENSAASLDSNACPSYSRSGAVGDENEYPVRSLSISYTRKDYLYHLLHRWVVAGWGEVFI